MFPDCHVHSSFSFDCEEPLASYVDRSAGLLLTTEHLELANSVNGGRDDVPDFARIARQMDRIRQEEADPGLKSVVGAEVGYSREHPNQLEDLLGGEAIDLRLLSFHSYRGHDWIEVEAHQNISDHDYAAAYFDLVLEGLQTLGGQVDVLTHLDYPFRYRPSLRGQAVFDEFAGPIGLIIDACAERGLVVELNTKSMYKYGDESFYALLLGMVAAKSGQGAPIAVCLGSDCHRASDWRAGFSRAEGLAAAHGLKPLDLDGLISRLGR
ncbi:histidinol phosphate phosphatase HisJ family protein [Bifidobacterium actinocoloniiforme DSM 22766]|uniref:Histidinol-phosphatase n=1 Tax=Bifidobacterium actinocoloniiforme DSM 22766 TaxID=1437605 RepID=A0A086Z202_9BIFI|nr:PHP domain-containing protein [Bifidobacterium actinocoloniiforme]AKV55639.1 hypothetical protein AB656_04900 [Bifidobacterium actinocoloniiforme DSM 22766]KFI40552.1 histidinol phosphate phosphatase HisJ family protein [Bifidobacterium actinocoloniiforme DSM 22766]